MSERIAFQSGAGVVAVDVDVPEAAPAVLALFPDDQVAPASVAPRFRLQRDGDGYALTKEGGRWRATSLPAILTRLELTLAETLVLESGFTGIHAAGVLLGGGALLFSGPGGCGKSSLAAAFASRGHPLFGDDVVLTDGTRVRPFRRLLKVEEPARTLLGLPPARDVLSRLWPEASFYHPRDLGSAWAPDAGFRGVILPRRTGGPPALEPAPPSAALAVLFAGVVLRERLGTDDFALVADVLERTPCYSLTYEVTSAAVEIVLAALA